MEEIKQTHYACLRKKKGPKDPNGYEIIVKIPCNSKEEAHEYISKHFDPEFHDQRWTE